MLCLIKLTALAVLLPLSLTAPTPQNIKPRAFRVTQVVNPFFSNHNGHAAWTKASTKYGANLLQESSTTSTPPATPKTKSLVAKPGDAEANPIDATDLEYLTPVIVGGKEFLLVLDTGSSNLWIGGSTTKALNKYTPTSEPLAGDTWSISYGDQSSAAGDVFSETVVVGETTATEVAVGRATRAPATFFNTGQNGQPGSDGLMGLGFSDMSTFQPQQKTWFDQAVSQGLPNVFAADLRYGLEAGSFDFGQIDRTAYEGEISYVDVVKSSDPSQQYWMVQPTRGDMGVIDTGTTLILLSAETNQKYYSQPAAIAAGARYNANAMQWEYRCNSTLPDFSVEFGANQAIVQGKFLNYQDLENGYCYSGIQNRPAGIPFSIYGDRFLMTLYVVFDQTTGSPRIGFASKKESSAV